ncbi:hypothetical protein EDB85DRAFT_2069021, partial [Lactarius pseudohatsudake]
CTLPTVQPKAQPLPPLPIVVALACVLALTLSSSLPLHRCHPCSIIVLASAVVVTVVLGIVWTLLCVVVGTKVGTCDSQLKH